MALIERDGKVYARKLWIFLGGKEWGNDLTRQVAREAFAADASLDAVQVHEHGGWHLTFLRDGTVVGTANDQAHLEIKPPSSSRASLATTQQARSAVTDTDGRGRARTSLAKFTNMQSTPNDHRIIAGSDQGAAISTTPNETSWNGMTMTPHTGGNP